jgi:hypothetical protein
MAKDMRNLLLIALLVFSVRALAQPPRWREAIASQADFEQMARQENEGRSDRRKHLMFVIDRLASVTQPQIYFVNTGQYRLHRDFLHATYLSLDRGQEFYRRHYREANRRFLLGTIAWHPRAGKFTFEFQAVDMLTPALLEEADTKLGKTFFAPLFFQANSAQHRQIAAGFPQIPQISAEELDAGDYLPLNQTHGIGVLRILDRMTEETMLDRNEIVIFREPPLTLTPVSGLITAQPGAPLAHVNLLAKSWKVPNAYIRDADKKFAPLGGKFVWFEVSENSFTLREAGVRETVEHSQRMARASDLRTPAVDLEHKDLTDLHGQRQDAALRFGAKSANLGEILHGIKEHRITGAIVPAGFGIPFFYYDEFLRENHLDVEITEMLGHDRFNHDPVYRRQRLRELRGKIQQGRLKAGFVHLIKTKVRKVFGRLQRGGVFARSSTNAEDLRDFSGAGLYTSVPNIRSQAALLEAIKTVWASLWNYAAYEARESAGINQAAVYAAVLVQRAVNADVAGVLITANVFDPEDEDAVYINAKRGLGMRVVEGQRVPEQLIYRLRSGETKVLTRSADETMLRFDERGGLRAVKTIPSRAVLSDSLIRHLAQTAIQIRQIFARGQQRDEQDIEWLMAGQQLYIVQSRPYVGEAGR